MLRWRVLRAGVGAVLVMLAAAASVVAQESTYDVVKKHGKLVAGVKYDFPPAGYVNKEGQVVGFDVDLVKYIANKMGVGVEVKQVTSQSRIPMLVNGNVDVVAAVMNPTRERAKVIDFSMVYFKGGQALLVRKGSGIKSIRDLEAPRTTATTQGSADGPGFMAFQPKGKLVYFQEHPQAVLALKQGRVDAVTTTDLTLYEFAKDNPDLEVIEPAFKPDPWALGLRQNDSKWRIFLDTTIMELWVSGAYQELHQKHFGRPVGFTLDVWPDFYKK